MELKHYRTWHRADSLNFLLIEPVWNWNFTRPLKMYAILLRLLIEPVWNWNCLLKDVIGVARHLLIEPVWNWNWNNIPREAYILSNLLIEPVWNWNDESAPASGHRAFWLLIEPVWNWNPFKSLSVLKPSTFNRTSMELKRGYHESPCQNDVTFNRTSMELKRFSLRRDRAAGRGF